MQKRFVMNCVKKEYVIRTLALYNIYKIRQGDIDKVCDHVANTITGKFISDSVIGQYQNEYGVTRRRSYISKITAANVMNVVLSIPLLIKEIKVTEELDENELLIASRKDNTLNRAARFLLDQAIIEYVHVQQSSTITSEENADNAFKRVALSLRKKQDRIE